MPAFYNDSAFTTNYGTAYIPITGANLTGLCLAENINITQPSQRIELRDDKNAPAGRIQTADFENGNTTLQVSGAFPSQGAQFGFRGTVYSLDEIGQQFAQGDVYKAAVTFTKKYNA